MKKILFLIICLSLYSCVKNKECNPLYIGLFKIDKSLINNKQLIPYVNKYHWDTIILRSDSSGKYSFIGKDKFLNECLGTWRTSSKDLEGNCTGYVKQENMENEFSSAPFDIWIKIEGKTYTLPFRKIK